MSENERNQSKVIALLRKKSRIAQLLFDHKDDLAALDDPVLPLSISELVKFANGITGPAHAPRGWAPGLPLHGSHPPAPQFDDMRLGYLGALTKIQPSPVDEQPTKRKRDDIN